ncbi:MAG: T9SS type A sorting domain-containing protein, partial [Bacteroidales bacterium]|nr:T9SS type A sorting domain-containing protein [Bacteroidales bacterium]
HSETGGLPLGIEIHGMAYAFYTPEDSALWNTTFLHYDIINLSDTTYHDTYMGVFTDTDLGYAWDDYVQCDVQRGFYFTYNGKEIDGAGQPEAYGEHPPAQGIMFLGGPFMDNDGIDNPKYDINNQQICDVSINGLNFGDTIVDNERLGMTNFLYHTNSGGIQGDPHIAPDYYNYMKGYWKDNTNCLYGGNGHINSWASGPECNFLFPGDSDTCNWGTNGILPYGGFNQNGLYWTEEVVWNDPSDRRGVGSSGPFTFKPGDVQQIDLAFVWARDYNGTPWSSVELLKEYCTYIKDKFENDYNFFSSMNNNFITDNNIQLFPNPVSNFFTVKLSHKITNGTYAVFNVLGENVISGKITGKSSFRINTIKLQKGLFIIRINDGKYNYIAKFIKK